MTEPHVIKRTGQQSRTVFLLLLLALMGLLLLFAPQVMVGVQDALLLCAKTIIPSLFPFMVLSELLTALIGAGAGGSTRADATCRKIFAVPATGMTAFFIGALCGFPLGVKCAADLYRAGRLTRGEAEQLIAFSNNTGPAFVIAGIGYNLFGNRALGVFLYVLQIVCALLSGWLLARLLPLQPEYDSSPEAEAREKSGGLVTAVRHSVTGVLSVCGMVVFFSIPMSLLRLVVKNSGLLAFICSFIEVGGAANIAAGLCAAAPISALLALTNAVCFAGLSVHLQASLFLSGLPISLHRHTLGKLLQSALACGIVFLSAYSGLLPHIL